eukprot:12735133-Heterocapsa_arctica.AAC.1
MFFLLVRLADRPGAVVAVTAVSPPGAIGIALTMRLHASRRPDVPWMLFEWACEGDSKLAQ